MPSVSSVSSSEMGVPVAAGAALWSSVRAVCLSDEEASGWSEAADDDGEERSEAVENMWAEDRDRQGYGLFETWGGEWPGP